MHEALNGLTISPTLENVMRSKETVWINPSLKSADQAAIHSAFSQADIDDAAQRLYRLAPLVKELFTDTAGQEGVIESPLAPAFRMQSALGQHIPGRLYIKRDDSLPIAGSVKARGGVYEVLKHAEELAIANGLYNKKDSALKLLSPDCRALFASHRIQVGSTGNLGLSIGITGAALGFDVTVHMSADARQWKKDLLRSHGVRVAEYLSDYTEAVKNGRRQSAQDANSYFVDDENSVDLFLGYAVAAQRLKAQLFEQDIRVDNEHPLFVYIPCGVGGAPAGIAFGLKLLFGDCVHIFLAEPVQAPCMLLGLATGLLSGICVQDAGLTGKTLADGLAVGRPSVLAGGVLCSIVSGIFTVQDAALLQWLRLCYSVKGLFLEPSACAGFFGPDRLFATEEGKAYVQQHGLAPYLYSSTHIVWATGGGMVPQDIREEYLRMSKTQ